MKLHATFSLELDEERLEEHRQELLDKGEALYDDELGKLWPGTPDEWTTLTDVVDLVDERAIIRTELVDVCAVTPDYGRPETRAGLGERYSLITTAVIVVVIIALLVLVEVTR